VIHVTTHALHRFQERVAPCSLADARTAIMSHAKAIETAASIGCEIVRCGNGERLVLCGTRVLTVYARRELPRQCRRSFREQEAY
jgi:hypothetical protein